MKTKINFEKRYIYKKNNNNISQLELIHLTYDSGHKTIIASWKVKWKKQPKSTWVDMLIT